MENRWREERVGIGYGIILWRKHGRRTKLSVKTNALLDIRLGGDEESHTKATNSLFTWKGRDFYELCRPIARWNSPLRSKETFSEQEMATWLTSSYPKSPS
ncbi:unnamed protein product [Microthlaspi erraticum]|uniref:Uncharacterized protein n=1 Tax=Microthlaspi erraticum TaxID=1685480 RepID=A0A6D2JCZ8_9BRAS|nr:unnamed protein product [Microthlaspi erraticum]